MGINLENALFPRIFAQNTKQHTMKKTLILLTLLSSLCTSAKESSEVLSLIDKVQSYWQAHNTPYCRGFWDNAAYFTGNMEAYRMTGRAEWYQYSDQWCRHNQWKGARSDNKKEWKYKWYGEGDDFVLFGDWQICFQTYVDMYHLVPAEYKVARAKEVMGYECDIDDDKFWWWADALYMVMPVMTKMYRLTGEQRYLDKLYANFLWSDSLMWDAEAQLYYRDGKYIWPKVKTACDGGKSFWARGDGWVLAGLAKVLADLPRDWAPREFFIKRFRQLAEGVARCQRPDGYWSRSMLCEEDAPGPETSGTAFFCYGLEWGVNHGYLDRAAYAETIEKAWNYLRNTALQEDGSVGYVQPIGEKPDPTRIVDARSQAPFGTGAWLLAACERVRYVDGTASVEMHEGAPRKAKNAREMTFTVENTTEDNREETVALDAQHIFGTLGIGGGRQFIVTDGDGVEQPYQICYDNERRAAEVLVYVKVAPGSTQTFRIVTGEPRQYRLDVNGRVYPNREDDLTWENDRCAWRFYGPRMHGKGVTGYDLFCKNQPAPIQDKLYQSELTSYGVNEQLKKAGRGGEWGQIHRDVYTYHRNRGEGMDAYTVGRTLGAGAPALMLSDGTLQMGDVWQKVQILENGPLRFAVKEEMYEQDGVKETRYIRQDKGDHMALCEVSYEGMPQGSRIVSGIVVHESQPTTYAIDKRHSYVAYADAMDTPKGQNGQLYLACLYPDKVSMKYLEMKDKTAGATGHVIGMGKAGKESMTYWFGSGWSGYDIPNMSTWKATLEAKARALQLPLRVK